jgi:P-type conjugative transfer protein TrbL
MPASVSLAFQQLLNAFIFTLTGSFARSQPEVLALFQFFATIELIMAALAWGFWRQNWMANIVWKVLGFGFLIWILESWPQLSTWLRNGFIEAGLLVGGSVMSVADITDPGNIVDFGMSVTALLVGKLGRLSIWNYGFEIIIGGLACLAIVAFYTWVAIHVFKALLEWYISAACLIFLVPFLAHEKTAPFAERVFGTFIAHAVRLMVYAAILSICLPILHTFKLSNDPKFGETMLLFACSGLFFVIGLGAPAMAMGMFSGAPVMTASNLLFGVQSAVQTAAAVGAVGAALSTAGAGAVRGAVTGASAYAHAAQVGAAQYGAAHPESSGLAQGVVGGAQGMGQYAAHSLTSGFRSLIQEGRVRSSQAFGS